MTRKNSEFGICSARFRCRSDCRERFGAETSDLVHVDDRSKESLDPFYQWLAVKKAEKMRGDVMDMWKTFKKSTRPGSRATLELLAKFLYKHAFEYTMKKIDGLEI